MKYKFGCLYLVLIGIQSHNYKYIKFLENKITAVRYLWSVAAPGMPAPGSFVLPSRTPFSHGTELRPEAARLPSTTTLGDPLDPDDPDKLGWYKTA